MYDRLIIGAGLYGLYSALLCAKQGDTTLVLECDEAPFKRASFINQARVHMGYHYPRSISTALKSKSYFDRFNENFAFCVNNSFDQIYATSSDFSWTDAEQFRKFCSDAGIFCDPVSAEKYFKKGMCDGAFLVNEFAYDARVLLERLLAEATKYPGLEIKCGVNITEIKQTGKTFVVSTDSGESFESGFVLNSTYASVNQIHALLDYEPFKIKYELCEIILCNVNDSLRGVGLTVMDGPFFSIMPFGNTGLHSLTSVAFTPHLASFNSVPEFPCQDRSNGGCSPLRLGNCNECPAKPQSAWPYMAKLAKKYMSEEFEFDYVESLYSIKPILKASEIDDSRPTLIRQYSEAPDFYSVLSGKINTLYDLDEVLKR